MDNPQETEFFYIKEDQSNPKNFIVYDIEEENPKKFIGIGVFKQTLKNQFRILQFKKIQGTPRKLYKAYVSPNQNLKEKTLQIFEIQN